MENKFEQNEHHREGEQDNRIRDLERRADDDAQVEAALRLALVLSEKILDTVREPMLVLDDKLRITTASRAFCRTFLVTEEETLGQLVYEIGNGQWNIPALRKLLEEVLPRDKSFNDFEVSHDFPALGRRIMILNGCVLWPPQGEQSACMLLVIEDVTDKKKILEELMRSNEDLQRFAYVAAHDLRSPLRSGLLMLQMAVQNFEQKGTNEADIEPLRDSVSNFKRLGTLMNDILSYAEMGNVSHRAVWLSLQGPVNIALENLQRHIRDAGATVDVGPMPSVRTDRTQMVMVFQNLIGNAVKYRNEKPLHIKIAAIHEAGHWLLSVEDNGRGFDPKHASTIFEPFRRLCEANVPGSGIGLATCKRVVEGMGGTIWAKSKAGEGSTFFFTVPDKLGEGSITF